MAEKIKRYSFGISGAPVAKARPFGYRAKSGKTIFFTPTKTKNFEHLVRGRAEKEIKKPMLGPVSIEIVFFLPRPQRLIWKKRPMPVVPAPKKPDIDNLAKTILDGLRGVAFIDDNQITVMHLYKRYHAGDRGPWTQIDIGEDLLSKELQNVEETCLTCGKKSCNLAGVGNKAKMNENNGCWIPIKKKRSN